MRLKRLTFLTIFILVSFLLSACGNNQSSVLKEPLEEMSVPNFQLDINHYSKISNGIESSLTYYYFYDFKKSDEGTYKIIDGPSISVMNINDREDKKRMDFNPDDFKFLLSKRTDIILINEEDHLKSYEIIQKDLDPEAIFSTFASDVVEKVTEKKMNEAADTIKIKITVDTETNVITKMEFDVTEFINEILRIYFEGTFERYENLTYTYTFHNYGEVNLNNQSN